LNPQEELLAVGAIAFLIANVLVIAAMLILADKRQSAAQVAHWSKGALLGRPPLTCLQR